MVKPVILDCSGEAMTAGERAVFKELKPYGFILFARNCRTPAQLRQLTDDMKEVTDRADVPILIDQEGGRVCRLNPDHWRKPPSGEQLRDLYLKDKDTGLDAARVNGRLMAEELRPLGITVNCTPVVDLRFPGADQVIGDRSFGDDVDIVVRLAAATCEGLLSGGILPVIKHVPGHGRARVDSHIALPGVDTPLDILRKTDFAPFRALSHMPLMMTAHIVYSDIDAENPATLSEKLITRVVRGEIGFEGLLISDDVTMKALNAKAVQNARRALEAGCDLVLHCNASLEERRQLLEDMDDMGAAKLAWMSGIFARRRDAVKTETAELADWLDKIL